MIVPTSAKVGIARFYFKNPVGHPAGFLLAQCAFGYSMQCARIISLGARTTHKILSSKQVYPWEINAVNMTEFFATLGAPLVNSRWSWGAVRPDDKSVFLREWQDRIRSHEGTHFVQVEHNRHPGNNHGQQERLDHVRRIREGAPCYLIMCEAEDTTMRPRRVRTFNTTEVFPGGRIVELEGESWVELLPPVSVEELVPVIAGGSA